MEIRPGVTGVWCGMGNHMSPSFPWQAQWIWMPDDLESDMMLARRSFELPERPENAWLRITATSQYQLYVNGRFVCRGPARCAPHHQSFDVLEISGLLHRGKNSLAVRVHLQQGVLSYHHDGRPGLLAQLDLSSRDQDSSIVTNSRWKVHSDPAWDNAAPCISRFHLEVCDRVDMRRQIKGWPDAEFDDGEWQAAQPLKRNVGWPLPAKNARPQALTPPWTSLVPRDIPYLRETNAPAVDLIEASTIGGARRGTTKSDGGQDEWPAGHSFVLSKQVDAQSVSGQRDYRENQGPLVLPASEADAYRFLLFDFGEVFNARPQLDIQGPAGTVVNVLCAPYMVDDRFAAKIVDSDLIDRVVLSGRRDTWEAVYFKPTRYLGIVSRSSENPIKIYRAGVSRIEYPFETKGSFQSPGRPWLQRCWQAAAKTIRVCTTDAYTDNYRERRQYAQTGYYAALGNYAVFGDTELQRRYLRQIADEQQASGLMPAYAPLTADDYMVILDSNCFWVRSLHNYLLYSGDTEGTLELLPTAERLLKLLHGYTDSHGLLNNPPYAYWLDHAINDRRGANFCLNGHYLGSLEDYAEVLDWLNRPDAKAYRDRAERLRQSLRTHFWDPQRQLFADASVDGQRSELFSEHANAMALAMNVATSEQAAAIAQKLIAQDGHDFIRRASGMTVVTPAMSYFLHLGLCRHGYVEDSLRMLRERFDRMLQPDTNETLWEEWWLDATGRNGKLSTGRTRSDAQTESAFPPALFTEYVLGIRPTQPGLKEVELFRSPSGVRHVEGTFPAPMGSLAVRWTLDDSGSGELTVDVPGTMQVQLNLASLGHSAENPVVVDGRRLENAALTEGYHLLTRGRHQVRF